MQKKDPDGSSRSQKDPEGYRKILTEGPDERTQKDKRKTGQAANIQFLFSTVSFSVL